MPGKRPPAQAGGGESEAKKAKKGAKGTAPAMEVFDINNYVMGMEVIPFDRIRVDKERAHGQVQPPFPFEQVVVFSHTPGFSLHRVVSFVSFFFYA